MGWIADSLVLDYLRVQECKCKGWAYSSLFDFEIGDEDASALDSSERHESDDEDADTLNRSRRREACMSITNTLRRRFLQVEPEDSVTRLSVPKTPLRLW